LAGRSKLLWVSQSPAPDNVLQAARDAWELTPYSPDGPLCPQLSGVGLAVVYPDGQKEDPRWLPTLLAALDDSPTVAVVLLPETADAAWSALCRRGGQFLCVRADAPAEVLAGRFAAAEALQPALASLRAELAAARRTAAGATRAFEDMTEEMRLAARLQRDFLPRRLPEVGSARFGVLYRPVSWVSGDIYDVARLDETHVGFYVADAVGHGMPAALLTMFIKKALQTKRIVGNTYQIVPPHVSLCELNADICEQNLSSCQFCTAVYCVLDTASLILTYARAGHPEPILIHKDGTAEMLLAQGSLLGVFPGEQYESQQAKLRPGDRLLVYTDGVEAALCGVGRGVEEFMKVVAPLVAAPREEMLLRLTSWIDGRGQVSADDITVIVMDV